MTFLSWLHQFFAPDNGSADTPENNTPAGKEPHILTVNKELSQYLDNYVVADKECPEFAVGIYGDWGIGKTFFIQEWLEYHSISHCYLSLFGISSTDDIEKAIFKTEHPVLSSPALQATLEVASVLTQNNGLSEKFPPLLNALNGELQKLNDNIPQYAENLSKKNNSSRPLLVFDDIERTSLPYQLLFGYLSMLLQSRHYKIILLYNRDKLANIYEEQQKDLDTNNTLHQSFHDLLQKAVGVELSFKGDFEDALETIFAQQPKLLNSKLFKEILSKNGNNLRQVKQALWRFKYRWPNDIQLSEKRHLSVFSLYLAATCTFPDLPFKKISRFATPLSVNKDPCFYDQYDTVIPTDFDCPLSPDLMASLVCLDMPRDKLRQAIRDFLQAAAVDTPAWRTLMDYNHITRAQFDKAFAEINSRLKSPEPQEVGELLHIAELADHLKKAQYITEATSSELLCLTDSKLALLFTNNPENLAFLATTPPNLLTWGGYGISLTEHVQSLHQKYNNLLLEKRADRMTEALSAPSVNFELIRDSILQRELPLSQKLCDRNVSNFIQLLSQPDASAENTRFAVFFMKEMQRQQLDAKAYFTNVLNQIQPPENDRFALARYQLMKKTLTIALDNLNTETT